MLQTVEGASGARPADEVALVRDVLACTSPEALGRLLQDRLGVELMVAPHEPVDSDVHGRGGLRVGRLSLSVPPALHGDRQLLELILRTGHLVTIGAVPPPHRGELFQQAVKVISTNVLGVLERGEVLSSIANSVLHLLDADICGVLLDDGDGELAMAACAGQRTLETQQLHMRPGQGLAGEVLRTGEPRWVDDYVANEDISADFIPLAVAEGVVSALAVPLRSRNEFIGVLEVWRRRPAQFDEDAIQLMSMVADMVSIAIDNAKLYEVQHRALSELLATESALTDQVERMRSTADLQRKMMDAIIDDSANVDIPRLVGEALDCEALLLGPDRELRSMWAPRRPTPGLAVIVAGLPLAPGVVAQTELPDKPGHLVWAQLVQAGSPDPLAIVAVAGPRDRGTEMSLALGQSAGFVALQRLAERAAADARAEARDDLLWELIDDDADRRRSAVDQARRWGVDLSLDHRFLVGRLDHLGATAPHRVWSLADLDQARKELDRAVHRVLTRHGGQLGAVRGDRMVLAVRDGDAAVVARDLEAAIERIYPATDCWWGVSGLWTDPARLDRSFAQARTAQRAARRASAVGPLLYDDLGVIGLLVSDGDGPDLADFVRSVLGAVVDYDATSDDWTLIVTLEAYFRHDCSQKDAAASIPVHHKTMRYRLDRIEELAGLDLRSHRDRQRTSLAIEIMRVVGDGSVTAGASRLSSPKVPG